MPKQEATTTKIILEENILIEFWDDIDMTIRQIDNRELNLTLRQLQ